MTRRALPYRVPPEHVVDAGDWKLVLDDDHIPMPTELLHWDYLTDIELCRNAWIDVDRARERAGLGDDSVLILAAVWTSSGSNLRGPGEQIPITTCGFQFIETTFKLTGAELGGTLILDTALVVADPGIYTRPAAPHRAGSVLWSDRHSLRLQGDAPQFPIAVIDFDKTVFPACAAWHLQIGDNLDRATMGSLLLLVNEQNDAAVAAVQNAGRPRDTDKLVFSAIKADVSRIMVEHALRQNVFQDGAEFGKDTLGETLSNLTTQLFPNTSITDLRLRMELQPNLFASDIQNSVKLFEVS